MADIYIGTSGYDYPEWKGVLYPHDLGREGFLAFYAEHFTALEINYTYYGMPNEYQMDAIARKSNGNLRFSVKAHKSLTHEVSISQWRKSAEEYRQALRPLVERNLLLSVLLQFPQSFHYEVDERRYLDALVNTLSPLPLVVEFRHASWQTKRVFDSLRERGISWCVTDMPQLKHLPAPLSIQTAASAYIRLHGRNAESWYGTNSRDRYDYLYSDTQLSDLVPLVHRIAASSRIVQIYFNNHAKGQAVVNARKLKLLLNQ
ncbi:MAG: DUF72 domain-containing protein [Spirochaetales bacterium]|nr:DUF72 domain-containing protein [Spirochaetales bacterium]